MNDLLINGVAFVVDSAEAFAFFFGKVGAGLIVGMFLGYICGKGWIEKFLDWTDRKGDQWGW